MSLFERIQNKRYDLQEKKKNMQKNVDHGFNNEDSDNKNEIEIDKKKRKDDYIKQQAKKANTTPSELKRRFKGATYDDEPFSKTPRKFDTPYTSKSGNKKISPSFFDKRQEFKIGDDGRPSKEAVKQRLQGRIISQSKRKIEQGDKLDIKTAADINTKKKLIQKGNRYVEDPKRVSKLVDRIAKNQELNTATGKKSSLFKTLKKYSDVTNPTIKGASGGKLPMPDGPKRDAAIKKGKDKFFNANKKLGNLGREFDLQFKADKLRLDAGGRIAKKDPKIAKMTRAQKKANFEKIKAAIDKKNPTFKSPASGGKLPMTKVQAFKNSASKTLKKTKPILKGLKSKAVRFSIRHPGKALAIGTLGVLGATAGVKTLMNKGKGREPISNKNTRSLGPTLKKDGTPVEYQYSLSGKTLDNKRIKNVSLNDISKRLKSGKYTTTKT